VNTSGLVLQVASRLRDWTVKLILHGLTVTESVLGLAVNTLTKYSLWPASVDERYHTLAYDYDLGWQQLKRR
jgi:hypothetical protein